MYQDVKGNYMVIFWYMPVNKQLYDLIVSIIRLIKGNSMVIFWYMPVNKQLSAV